MDSGTVFYIIAIIIYFIYTAFIQKKEGKKPEQDVSQEPKGPQRKGGFEELLREIRREQAERERDIVFTGERAEKEPEAKKNAPAKFPKHEEPVFPKPVRREYQEIKQPLVKLDDQIDINDDRKILGEVEDVAEEASGVSKYASILKNRKSAREAIILSEIINRKHF
ncbi:hypothetical protein [Negadavirga shengliensis]|uniref:Uncharacterized protein n=1 Tax=Negadavirga shengliensis TaxID=1389218 RepID=A0ABV9T1H5_9BACT